MIDRFPSSSDPQRTMYPGRMSTTDPEATAAKQNWPDEASAAARNELIVAMTILGQGE